MRQLVFAGSKADRRYAHCHGRNRIGAKIPEIKFFQRAAINTAIRADQRLHERMERFDLPRVVHRLICERFARPRRMAQRTHLPRRVFARDKRVHLRSDLLERFAQASLRSR
ncbi:hypothetical protein SDC9_172486 [bioreactor metagenome]|uniref:Uncharacterized protein n=1 Tax=bioreactor metagenome TaxID=1076179 RepID=A0A645GH08_9ZZZZ